MNKFYRRGYLELLLLPATKLGQGNVFTGVCDSVNRGSASVHAGIADPPEAGTPPGSRPPGSRHLPPTGTPRADTPHSIHTPRHRAYWEIRSTRGRYASYWNAILLVF